MTEIVEIRLTEDVQAEKVKLLKGFVFKAQRMYSHPQVQTGWRLEEKYGQYPSPFIEIGFAEEVVERTYTEAEMKEIRREWEEKLAERDEELKDAYGSVGTWREMYTNESAERIKLQREKDSLIKEIEDSHKARIHLMSTGNARRRRLDLLEPEIERIEAAVNRVVPEEVEGTLAEHVENIVSGWIDFKMAEQYREHGFSIESAFAEGEPTKNPAEKLRRVRHMR